VSTSGFTEDARAYALEKGIELVDGAELAKQLLETGIAGLTIEGRNFQIIIGGGKKAAYYDPITKKFLVK